jgi:hypothetical protein
MIGYTNKKEQNMLYWTINNTKKKNERQKYDSVGTKCNRIIIEIELEFNVFNDHSEHTDAHRKV